MKTIKCFMLLLAVTISLSVSANDDIWGNRESQTESNPFYSNTDPFGESQVDYRSMQRVAPPGGGGGVGVIPVRDVFTLLFFGAACYGAFLYRNNRKKSIRMNHKN